MKLQMTEPYYLIQQAPHNKQPHLTLMPFSSNAKPTQKKNKNSSYAFVMGERSCKQTNTMIHS